MSDAQHGSESKGNALATNRHNILPCTAMTSKVVQSKGWLSAMYDIMDGSLDQ